MTERTCAFCDYDGPSPVLADYGDVFVIEPLSPVTDGHLLVIPKEHVADFAQRADVTAKVAGVAARMTPSGVACNLITSKGEAATQTVPHLHFHLVPRREGDDLMLPWSRPDEHLERVGVCPRCRKVATDADLGGEDPLDGGVCYCDGEPHPFQPVVPAQETVAARLPVANGRITDINGSSAVSDTEAGG